MHPKYYRYLAYQIEQKLHQGLFTFTHRIQKKDYRADIMQIFMQIFSAVLNCFKNDIFFHENMKNNQNQKLIIGLIFSSTALCCPYDHKWNIHIGFWAETPSAYSTWDV